MSLVAFAIFIDTLAEPYYATLLGIEQGCTYDNSAGEKHYKITLWLPAKCF